MFIVVHFSQICLLVYDVTNKTASLEITEQLIDLRRMSGFQPAVCCIIGNKVFFRYYTTTLSPSRVCITPTRHKTLKRRHLDVVMTSKRLDNVQMTLLQRYVLAATEPFYF